MEKLCAAMASGAPGFDIEVLLMSVDKGSGDLFSDVCHNGLTLLCLACRLNRTDLVSLLLQKGASPSVPSSYLKRYPLHYACDHSAGNVDSVQILLCNGAEPNIQDEDGNTPLHLACTESNVAVVKILLEAGADVNRLDVDNESPLIRACFAKSVELIDLLLKAGSDPNYPDGRPLEIVVRAPSLEALKLLIAAGAEVTRKNYLSFASEHNYLDMMKVLHNHGADVNSMNQLRLTALHHACMSHQATHDAVRLLLTWGADPNISTHTGDTAVHFACQNFAPDKVRLLLMYGVDINRINGTHMTPLVAALTTRRRPPADASYMTLIKLLLAAGARLSCVVLERIKALIYYLQSSATDKEELFSLLTHHTSQPSTLQHLCRTTIRFWIHGNVDQNAERLPVPNSMISFMQFDDVPECSSK